MIYQIRYVVQESADGVLWHDLADCASEEEAVAEVIELQDKELKRKENNMEIDEAWLSLDECIDTIAKNELKARKEKQ